MAEFALADLVEQTEHFDPTDPVTAEAVRQLLAYIADE